MLEQGRITRRPRRPTQPAGPSTLFEIDPLTAWAREERELSPDIAAALAATGVAKVIPLDTPGRWTVETESRVGIVVGRGWELRIRPRMAIPKLMFLLAYSRNPAGWADAIADMDTERDVLEALAAGFAIHAQAAVERGVLHGYIGVEDRLNHLRGRVRFGDQLARLPGLPLPVEVSFDEFTPDVIENRLLRTAAETLLAFPRIPSKSRSRLMRLRAVLENVTVIPDRRSAQIPPITRLNKRYEPALVLAKLVLDGVSLRQDHGRAPATSFLFDMNEVFESFVYAALREALREYGGSVERQAAGELDTAPTPALRFRADVVWRSRGAVRAVIDSKYKPLSAGGTMPNADAYQMLAYCVGFGLRRGFLVYARDTGTEPRLHRVKRHGYEIDVEALDVELEPEKLLHQVDALATRIAAPLTRTLSLSTESFSPSL